VVDEVPELVEHGHDVVVLHQAACGREVAHQDALGQPLPSRPERSVNCGRVLVLALARVHVEVDPAQPLGAAEDVVGIDLGRPHVGVLDLLVAQVDSLPVISRRPLLTRENSKYGRTLCESNLSLAFLTRSS